MPIDPRLPLTVQAPKFSSPLDDYAKFMSLRDLVDQRRYREMQVRQLELKAQQEQREEEERQAFKAALAVGAKPEALIAANPELGIKYATNLATMQREQRAADTAKLTHQKTQDEIARAETERRRALNQQMADIGMEAVKIKDPAEREQFFHTQLAGSLIDRGYTPAQEFGGYRVPANEREAQFAYGSAHGADKLRAYLGAQAEAQRKAEDYVHETTVKRPLEEKKLRADATRAEQIEQGTARPSPAAPPALFENWYQGYLQKNGLKDNATTRYQATEAWIAANRPQFAQPGVDVPLPAAVAQQRVDIARQTAEANAAAAGTKPNAEFNKKMLALQNLRSAFTAYKKELESVGPTFLPGKGAKLNSLYRDLQLQQKEAANLGALAGPDLGILEQLITPPSGFLGNYMGTSALLDQITVGNEVLGRNEKNLRSVYGQSAPSAAPPGAGNTGGAPGPVTGAGTGVTVTAPNGRTYVFPNAAAADVFKKRAGIK